MTTTPSRRRALIGSLLAAGLPALPRGARARSPDDAPGRLAEIERRHGGRLGVCVLDPVSGTRVAHRAEERFLACSTFKVLAAAFVLARVDAQQERLDRRVVYARNQLVEWSPVTQQRVGGAGMTVAELCEAAIILSDNTAANLLLTSFGGPAALTAYARSLGDAATRLDRIEPALNEHDGPGDLRDTTTPAAMAQNLRRLLFGQALTRASRDQLSAWLITNKTGDKRLRAGFPQHWLVGDKTGTNASGTANDVGVAWAAERTPVIVAAYCEMPALSADERDAVLAEVGRIAAQV